MVGVIIQLYKKTRANWRKEELVVEDKKFVTGGQMPSHVNLSRRPLVMMDAAKVTKITLS